MNKRFPNVIGNGQLQEWPVLCANMQIEGAWGNELPWMTIQLEIVSHWGSLPLGVGRRSDTDYDLRLDEESAGSRAHCVPLIPLPRQCGGRKIWQGRVQH